MRNRLVVCILILSVCGCTLFGLGDPEYGWVLRSVDISPDELVVPRGARVRVGVDLKTREHDLLPCLLRGDLPGVQRCGDLAGTWGYEIVSDEVADSVFVDLGCEHMKAKEVKSDVERGVTIGLQGCMSLKVFGVSFGPSLDRTDRGYVLRDCVNTWVAYSAIRAVTGDGEKVTYPAVSHLTDTARIIASPC